MNESTKSKESAQISDETLLRAYGAGQAALGLSYLIPSVAEDSLSSYPHTRALIVSRAKLHEVLKSLKAELISRGLLESLSQ